MLEERVGDAHRRHAMEPFHEEAKGEVGWEQYQGWWVVARLSPTCGDGDAGVEFADLA
jgi:hypothetical protein